MYSENVKYFRKKLHMTQDDLALKIGVKRHTVCDWESGRTEPNIACLKKLASLFNITVDFLLGLDNSCENNEHVVVEKFECSTELEHELLTKVSQMTKNQQEKMTLIINSLKGYNE